MDGGLEKRPNYLHTSAEEIYAEKEKAAIDIQKLEGLMSRYNGLTDRLKQIGAEYVKVRPNSAEGMRLSDDMEDVESEQMTIEQELRDAGMTLGEAKQKYAELREEMKKHLH